MKIALIMDNNAYAGREYAAALNRAAVPYHALLIGKFKESDPIDDERTAGLWKPPAQSKVIKDSLKFDSLKAAEFAEHLEEASYDLGIQGGTGILKNSTIEKFGLGILNFHPGDLPEYRGCSAPEWQIEEGRKVVCTCHLVDEGIDTGPIYKKRELALDYSSYNKMRAGVYPEVAQFVADVVSEIVASGGFAHPPKTQDEGIAKYREYIGDERIEALKTSMK